MDVDDSLKALEQFRLAEAAAAGFPAHDFALRRNDEGMTWAVLSPRTTAPALLHFTICRIEPCIVVLVVDHEERRQFCSVPSVEDAIAFARQASDQAAFAAGSPTAARAAEAGGDRVLH